MPTDAKLVRKVFADVHRGLPRQAPGSFASTQRAFSACDKDVYRILDIGCGPGMNALQLADIAPHAIIIGVDLNRSFIEEANLRAANARVADRVSFQEGDMANLPFADQYFDAIWSEGAAYFMGVENALDSWRSLLAPGGVIAYTDAVFLHDNPPQELASWWLSQYPDMQTMARREAQGEALGFQLLDSFALPDADWWEYYKPMQERIDSLREKYQGDLNAESVLESCQLEIDMYGKYSKDYGYGFFIQQID
ncbi:MAG: class I SAM-dependent methyltransferase [Pseudomonadota bacterium]